MTTTRTAAPNVTRNSGKSVHAGRWSGRNFREDGTSQPIQACQAYANDLSWVPTGAPVTCKSCTKILAALTR